MWQYNHTISSEEEQYLMHYGVKGMKWRKRKAVGPQFNQPAGLRQMRNTSLPQTRSARTNLRNYAAKVSQHNRATSKNTADANSNKRIQRARAIEKKYGKGTMKSAKAIRRDQQLQNLKGNLALKGRQAGYYGKKAARAGAKAAKSKANQAVNSLKAEINKRKRISSAKKTAKARLKKYKNSTTGYQRRIK